MTFARILISWSWPRTVLPATTIGEKMPSLCGLAIFFFGGFFKSVGVGVATASAAAGMGGMSIISFAPSSSVGLSASMWFMMVWRVSSMSSSFGLAAAGSTTLLCNDVVRGWHWAFE